MKVINVKTRLGIFEMNTNYEGLLEPGDPLFLCYDGMVTPNCPAATSGIHKIGVFSLINKTQDVREDLKS